VDEAPYFGDGDVEPTAAFEPGPTRADVASSPVADGAWWCVDEFAELLEGEQVVVVPFLGDVDGFHVLVLLVLSSVGRSSTKGDEEALCDHGRPDRFTAAHLRPPSVTSSSASDVPAITGSRGRDEEPRTPLFGTTAVVTRVLGVEVEPLRCELVLGEGSVTLDVLGRGVGGVGGAEVGAVAAEDLDPLGTRVLEVHGDEVALVVVSTAGHADVGRCRAGGLPDEQVRLVDRFALGSVDGGGVGELDVFTDVVRGQGP
jgi:hypothetical protein